MRDEMPIDPLLDEVDRQLTTQRVNHDDFESESQIASVRTTPEWTTFRDNLAITMFEEYQRKRGHVN